MMSAVLESVGDVSPAQWCRTFFLVAASIVLVIQALPNDVRRTLMAYGARRPASKDDARGAKADTQSGAMEWLAETLTSYGQVPHHWFLHFYILSTSLSVFWAWQYITRGSIMQQLAQWQHRDSEPSVSSGQAFIAWSLMAVQGVRRLYESLYVSKPGKSPMWFVHWALGLVYYASISVSVWIQGSSAILASWEDPASIQLATSKLPLGLLLYCFASVKQNECHRYLASLKKYTLPTEGWFKYIVCPHYTFECLLYVAIAWIAAPPGQIFNRSVLCGLVFVAVNLGATAHGTKKWYAEKFGQEKVAKRWKMIPLVF